MKFTLKNTEIQRINNSYSPTFPKYTSQLINWANQNAQGTRPRVVGQMSDLFQEYIGQASIISSEEWERWYRQRHPYSITVASDKIFEQIKNLQEAIMSITRNMVEEWVKDLIVTKTYNGMYLQHAILETVANQKQQPYRLAIPAEESLGIDGFIGNIAYSIKPDTYKTMNRLPEDIYVKIIYYTKTKTGLTIELEE